MYRILSLFISAILMFVICTSGQATAQTVLPVGSSLPLPDQSMEEVSGRNLSLSNLTKENGLLVIFSCNTCPWVLRWQDRMLSLASLADENNIGIVALNSNEAYRDRGDDLEDMIKHAEKAGYNFPYLLDEGHIMADVFGATRTPQVFLFNADLELVYTGAIDDNANNANGVRNFYVQKAIEAILTGAVIETPSSALVGCTIKRTG